MAGYARRKKKKTNLLAMFVIVMVLIAMAGVLKYQTDQLNRKNMEYQIRLASLESELATEKARAEKLEERRIYVQTKQYIEEQAKSKLGLVNPGEILLKPVGQ